MLQRLFCMGMKTGVPWNFQWSFGHKKFETHEAISKLMCFYFKTRWFLSRWAFLAPIQIWTLSMLTCLKMHITWPFTVNWACVGGNREHIVYSVVLACNKNFFFTLPTYSCLLLLWITRLVPRQQIIFPENRTKMRQGNVTPHHIIFMDNAIFLKHCQ